MVSQREQKIRIRAATAIATAANFLESYGRPPHLAASLHRIANDIYEGKIDVQPQTPTPPTDEVYDGPLEDTTAAFYGGGGGGYLYALRHMAPDQILSVVTRGPDASGRFLVQVRDANDDIPAEIECNVDDPVQGVRQIHDALIAQLSHWAANERPKGQ